MYEAVEAPVLARRPKFRPVKAATDTASQPSLRNGG
jgi:hypothetical protein